MTMTDVDVTFPEFEPSDFSARLYNSLPECYRVVDAALGQPLLRYQSGIGDVAGQIDTLYDRFAYIAPADGGPPGGPGSTSDLVDPNTADPAWLGWQAQALNVPLDPSAPLPTQRAQLSNPSIGWNAGTMLAIIAAAKTYLKGEQLVTVTQQVGDQWHYTVSVYATQVEGETYGQIAALYPTYAQLNAAFATYAEWTSSLAALEAALAAQNPAGMLQTITVLTGSTYAVIDTAFTPYSALNAAFATYADMNAYIP